MIYLTTTHLENSSGLDYIILWKPRDYHPQGETAIIDQMTSQRLVNKLLDIINTQLLLETVTYRL